MRKFLERLGTFLVALPALVAVVLLLPMGQHIVFNLLVIAATIGASLEVEGIFRHRGFKPERGIAVASGVLPVVAYLQVVGVMPPFSDFAAVTFLVAFVLVRYVFVSTDDELSTVLNRTSSSLIVLLYPAIFASFLVRISGFSASGPTILIFLFLIFTNDTAAYVFGSLFGKASRKIVPASPNKSLIGFFGGFLGSMGAAAGGFLLFPQVFDGRWVVALTVGAVLGVTTILGDLSESALKRSARVKDSGWIIPGRGGILDSTDSIFYSAPFFYAILKAFSVS